MSIILQTLEHNFVLDPFFIYTCCDHASKIAPTFPNSPHAAAFSEVTSVFSALAVITRAVF